MKPALSRKESILLVDDNPEMLLLLKSILGSAGYETCPVSEPHQVLRIAHDKQPDLILLDIMMPGMDGIEVKKLLSSHTGTSAIPVVFLSAKNTVPDKITGLETGVDDYITKPFNKEELIARIGSILKRRNFYEKVSMTDGLTGVYNRQFFEKQFSLLTHLARRHKANNFSLVILDVNDFKIINDTYGHMTGDRVLRSLAEILKLELRDSDIITRYGGDEFVVLLPEVTAESALTVFKRVKKSIALARVPDNNDNPVPYSVSFGISYCDMETPGKEVFRQADEAMYEFKKKRKKQTAGR